MRYSDLILKSAIIADLEASERRDAIGVLLALCTRAIGLTPEAEARIRKRILAREAEGTTAFGKGIALPHAKDEALNRVVAAIGRSARGIEYGALDSRPVHLIILVLGPAGHNEQHISAMSMLFGLLQDDASRRFLVQADTVDKIWEVILEADGIAA